MKNLFGYKLVRATKLCELKDVASGTEEITWSRVNYLRHLMNEIRFIKKSRRKSEYLSKNTSTSFCLIAFLFSLHFCLLRNFEIVRCIVKSLIAIQHIFVEVLLKKEIAKSVNLRKESIKILLVHLSYNEKLQNELNFCTTIKNICNVIKLW